MNSDTLMKGIGVITQIALIVAIWIVAPSIGYTVGQFLTDDTDQTISARHTFNPTVAGSPFLLGANAQNQKVVGFEADKLDGQEGSFYQNAGNMNAGTLADARLSGNVPLRDAANTFTAQQTISPGSAQPPLVLGANAQNQKVVGLEADKLDGQEGSFYQNAGNMNAGTLPDARLSSNVPLKNATNTFTAQQNISPGSVQPPFVLGANAQNQKVVGFDADKLDGLDSTALYGPGTQAVVVKAANESVTNSTTLQVDNHLVFPVSAGAWAFRLVLFVTDSSNTGITVQLVMGTGLSGCSVAWGTFSQTVKTSFSSTLSSIGSGILVIEGGLLGCTGSGNVELWWAQSSSSATAVTVLGRSTAWIAKDF